jgi:carboxypeptidase family protein/TonB-dependent receptor-like protein
MRVSYAIPIFCLAAAMLSGSLRAQAPGSSARIYRLSGVVTDSAHGPLAGVQITATLSSGEANRSAQTDSLGRFQLGSLGAGALTLKARRLGYASRTVQVAIGTAAESTTVAIVLAEVPAELQDVLVTAPLQGKLQGFYQRRQQRGPFARFLDENEIRRMGPRNASDLFRTMPGIALASTSNGGNAIRIRGCQPMVWVDGQRVPGAELDEVIFPSDIAAIEFYASSAGIPAQYLERGNRLCGLILVWTKTG